VLNNWNIVAKLKVLLQCCSLATQMQEPVMHARARMWPSRGSRGTPARPGVRPRPIHVRRPAASAGRHVLPPEEESTPFVNIFYPSDLK
jgi:hypothetical protein